MKIHYKCIMYFTISIFIETWVYAICIEMENNILHMGREK